MRCVLMDACSTLVESNVDGCLPSMLHALVSLPGDWTTHLVILYMGSRIQCLIPLSSPMAPLMRSDLIAR